MSLECIYKRPTFSTLPSTIQGKIKFSKFGILTFYLNNIKIETNILLNNENFVNGTNPSLIGSGLTYPLTDTYLGYEIPFLIEQIPNVPSTSLTVTGAQINFKQECVPEIQCNYSITDSMGVQSEGHVTVTTSKERKSLNIPLQFFINGNSDNEIGTPYQITLYGKNFRNQRNVVSDQEIPFSFLSTGIPIQELYINNFLCKNSFLPFTQTSYKRSTFRSEPWFWDMITGIFVIIFWIWFYTKKIIIYEYITNEELEIEMQ